ncbi:MAG: hypothetical protein K6U11_10990 [bacterium]|nr:hypothetical protein [bacterium]
MSTKYWKLILAAVAVASFTLASLSWAQLREAQGTMSTTSSTGTMQEDPNRSAQWYISQTVTTPFGTSYKYGAGPDWGIGPTFMSSGYYSPIFGSANTTQGGMTYAGGLPLYSGPGTPYGNMSYGPFAGLMASTAYGGATGLGYGLGGYGGYGLGVYGGLGLGGYGGLAYPSYSSFGSFGGFGFPVSYGVSYGGLGLAGLGGLGGLGGFYPGYNYAAGYGGGLSSGYGYGYQQPTYPSSGVGGYYPQQYGTIGGYQYPNYIY